MQPFRWNGIEWVATSVLLAQAILLAKEDQICFVAKKARDNTVEELSPILFKILRAVLERNKFHANPLMD